MPYVDPIESARQHSNPGKPTRARGTVIGPPNAVYAPMIVMIVGGSRRDAYTVPGSNWMPRPNPIRDTAGDHSGQGLPLIPQRGDTCLIVFDHLGDPWVPVWGTEGIHA